MKATAIFSVEDKAAFVTGAGAGLGRVMAQVLAANGAKVACFDADLRGLEETLALLEGNAFAFAGDVRDADAVAAAIAQTADRFGHLDIAIANAGVSDRPGAILHETDPAEWQKVVDINLHGVFNTCRPALARMVRQKSGKVITVASMWGLAGPAGVHPRPAYGATKGAVVNLTRELGLEYAPYNIQVNAICPGFFRTAGRPRDEASAKRFADYTPMGRIAAADEIMGTTLYLASSASDFVTGTTLVIDGGVLAK